MPDPAGRTPVSRSSMTEPPRAIGAAPGRTISHHLTRCASALTMVLMVAWIFFAILVLVLRYALLPHVGDYRGRLERMASDASGETVRIGAIDASWRGLRPSLTLRDIDVVDASGQSTLRLPSVAATLSWESLAVLQLRLASLEIDGAQIVISRDEQGRLSVAGYPLKHKTSSDNPAAEWLLSQDAIRIRDATVRWHDAMVANDATGTTIAAAPPDFVLGDVTFAVERSGWRHRFALKASPPTALAAPLDVRAVIDHPLLATRLADPSQWSGEIYADVASGDVAAWRTWLPLPETLDSGQGRVRAWMRFTREDAPAGVFAHRLAERIKRPIPVDLDRIADITTDLALDHVAVRWGAVEYAALASIDGRIVSSQTKTEQRFSAVHMALQPRGGIKVAATDFEVRRIIGTTMDDESGKASLGAVDIGVSLGLVPLPLVPPAIAAKLAALKPRGTLERVALSWTGPIATPTGFDVEARFSQLGIAPQAPSIEAIEKASVANVAANGLIRKPHEAIGPPGFDHLAGTLRASKKPASDGNGLPVTEATISIDGANAILIAPGLFDDATLKFAHLAAQVGLRIVGNDLEVRVDHASLDNPDLAGTVALIFRHGPNADGSGLYAGRGYLDLDAHLTRAEVARVPRYLPNIIAVKARNYLTKALVAGKVGEAELRMRGMLEKLDLRAQADALAKPYTRPIGDVLAAVRDDDGKRAQSAAAAPRELPAIGQSDGTELAAEPIFHATIKIHDATFLYGPARNPAELPPSDAGASAAPAAPSIAWPAFDGMDADIVFDRARMTIHARTARVYGFTLHDVDAELPALADPTHVLRVSGQGSGPLQDLVRFIDNGPVSRWIRHFTDNTEATGNATLALALDLPLSHPRDAAVAGSIGFADDTLALNAIIPPFRRIKGRVDFSDRGLKIDDLTAQSLGGPLRIDAQTTSDGFIVLNAAGTIDIAALRAEAARGDAGPAATPVATGVERVARVMAGSTRYSALLRVRNSRVAALSDDPPPTTPVAPPPGTRPPSRADLTIESDLVGLAIDLPAPLAKPIDARWPLRVELSRSTSGGSNAIDTEDIHITLADRVDVTIARERSADGAMAVSRAGYRVGATADAAASPPMGAGNTSNTSNASDADNTSKSSAASTQSTIRVALPSLDLDAWRDAIREISAGRQPATRTEANTSFDHLLPAEASLTTPALRAGGRDFTHVALTARRMPTGWQADVDADQVAGRLSYTDVAGRTDARNGVAAASNGLLVARLSKLSIPQSEGGQTHIDSTLDASRQKDFPAIDLVADRFELRGRLLGRLEVVAENIGAGSGRAWKLDKLNLATPEARFNATGTWGHDGEAESTRLDFDLQASDVGALMDRFGLTRTIKSGSARLSGNAAWSGGPTTIDFSTLGGTMKLAADKGQFLKADPGIAKLLNIISLQGLARRLTLDFSDVFGAGFAFDTVRADAIIEHGIASTSDFAMKSGLANVEMKGTADLQHETTDLHVLVLPQVNAGAASLGVAVINPIVGLGTFVAQYLFKDRISQALSFEYNVTGPWSRPDVVKIDHNGKVTPVKPREPAPTSTTPASTATGEARGN